MYIRLSRLLEDDIAITNYDSKGRFCEKSQGLNWGDNREIEEALADAEDNKDKAEDSWKKNKRVKREKMCKKRLLKAEKKACLKAKDANNNKKAYDIKDASNDKNAYSPTPTVTNSPGFLASITIFLDPLAPVAASPGPSTPASVNFSPISTIGASVSVGLSPFSFSVRLFLFSFPACHTTPTSPSPMRVFRSILLPLKDD